MFHLDDHKLAQSHVIIQHIFDTVYGPFIWFALNQCLLYGMLCRCVAAEFIDHLD